MQCGNPAIDFNSGKYGFLCTRYLSYFFFIYFSVLASDTIHLMQTISENECVLYTVNTFAHSNLLINLWINQKAKHSLLNYALVQINFLQNKELYSAVMFLYGVVSTHVATRWIIMVILCACIVNVCGREPGPCNKAHFFFSVLREWTGSKSGGVIS